jgi:hypothetical protein
MFDSSLAPLSDHLPHSPLLAVVEQDLSDVLERKLLERSDRPRYLVIHCYYYYLGTLSIY